VEIRQFRKFGVRQHALKRQAIAFRKCHAIPA
jgi:hypothetical protein